MPIFSITTTSCKLYKHSRSFCSQFLGGLMMSKTIGDRIKTFRRRRGMTRKELARDICDESTLLRIEKDKQEPRLFTIQQLCKRLEIPISYIINSSEDADIDYFSHIKKLCREFVYHGDYEALQSLIKQVEESKVNLCKKEIYKKFTQWHKAILYHKKENNIPKAEHILHRLMPKNNTLVSETDIGIANSLGLIYMASDRIEEAKTLFHDSLLSIENLPFVEDKTLYVRVGYNYAHTLFLKQNYDEAINIGHKVLYHTQSNHLRYLVGRLHHMLSIAYEKLNELEEAEEYMTRATQIFLAESKLFFHVKALRALCEIQFKAGKTQAGLESLHLAEERVLELTDPKDLLELIEKMKRTYLFQGKI
jgi:transcriptional regulator with XRE-family HTH domain